MSGTLDWTSVEVAVPDPTRRRPGVSMAGFRQRVPANVDIGMVAHPSVTVLLDLGAGLVADNGLRGSMVIGLLAPAPRLGGYGVGACLQIRLSPLVAATVLGAPAPGALVSLDLLWGADAGRIEHRLRTAASWDERFAIVTEVLGRRLPDNVLVDPEVAHAWRRTRVSRGRVRVEGLAHEVGWSRQRMWSRFRSQLGITPKRAAQLIRFDHAAHLLAEGRSPAAVAAASGYVDQSHLHREIKAFTGDTPAAVAVAPWLAIDDVAWPP
ncbi:helix-turn-helix domain-containing protein [Asanoa sp. NPDC049518]|uniref:helix-turn-helix domain-containing protein n=1 Tax=unclassified Asanoa TaxID=2685164 RepID=UPI0034169862